MRQSKTTLNGGDLDIDFLFEKYNKDTDELSMDSLEKTAHLTENFSCEMRFMYDNFQRLLSYQKFHNFAKEYSQINNKSNRDTMLANLSAPLIQTFLNEIKKDFVSLLVDSE